MLKNSQKTKYLTLIPKIADTAMISPTPETLLLILQNASLPVNSCSKLLEI
jgi:hypothetical protein